MKILDTKILKKIVENRVILKVDDIGEIEPENDDTRFLELTDLIEYSEQVEKGGKEVEEGSALRSQVDSTAIISETVSFNMKIRFILEDFHTII